MILLFTVVVFSGFFIPPSATSFNVFAADIPGTPNNDILKGTDVDYNIDSGDGDDINYGDNLDGTGVGGDDIINSGDGDDTNYAGGGDDTVTGGQGSDFTDCGKGRDTMTDFQPGVDKIKSCKPTIDKRSLPSTNTPGRNR